jgi:hypothetical protein
MYVQKRGPFPEKKENIYSLLWIYLKGLKTIRLGGGGGVNTLIVGAGNPPDSLLINALNVWGNL